MTEGDVREELASWHPIDVAIWRRKPGELCFRSAVLCGAKLAGVNLQGEDLTRADLRDADLRGANLSRAILLGANLSCANLQDADISDAVLVGADLSYANLRDADLSGASLRGANLYEANLRRAHLAGADIGGAGLSGASLFEAELVKANLSNAELWGADLGGANLVDADLSRASIDGANFGGSVIGRTRLLAIDLSPLCDARWPIGHYDQSYVDHEAVMLSIANPNLASFLQHVGMPEVFVDYMIECARSVATSVFTMLRSTFLSYGHHDEAFARKLYESLHRNGVTTFFFPEHAKPGEKLHRALKRGIAEHDRVVLICSRTSLDRKAVINELEETLMREHRDASEYLIPIRLDDYVFNEWIPKNQDLAQAVRSRVVADFEGADRDEQKFQAGLRKLIAALRK